MIVKCLVALMLVTMAVVPVVADTKYENSFGVIDLEPELPTFTLSKTVKETFKICGTTLDIMKIPNPFEVSGGADLGSPLQ